MQDIEHGFSNPNPLISNLTTPHNIYLNGGIETIEMENQLQSIRYWLKTITLLLVVYMYYQFFTLFGPSPLFGDAYGAITLILLLVIGISAIASLIWQLLSDISGWRSEI